MKGPAGPGEAFADLPSNGLPDGDHGLSHLGRLGFQDPREAAAHLHAIRADLAATGFVASVASGGPAHFAEEALVSIARAAQPDRALRDVAALLGREAAIVRASTTFSSSAAGEGERAAPLSLMALRRAVAIIAISPPLGALLLEDPSALHQLGPLAPGDDGGLLALDEAARLTLTRQHGGTEDESMRALRTFKHGRLLRILALDLEGRLDLDEVSDALTDLADLLLTTVLDWVSAQLGLGTPSPIGIVCYGKLGSREMSYGSDTDIVFVYDRTDGDYDEALVRLARVANRWITTATREGILYATDFRLRPYGDSGMLVSSLGAFRDYQLNAAWTWENQALTRARWIACSPALEQALDVVKGAVMSRPRAPVRLRDDVLDMRAKIFAAHRPPADVFDVKHSRGGIVDVEFIVQHMILRYAGRHPELGRVVGNAEALARGAALGLIPGALAQSVTAAYRQYRAWMHRERLSGNETVRVTLAQAEPHRRVVSDLWRATFSVEAEPG